MKVYVLFVCVALVAVQANAFWLSDPTETTELGFFDKIRAWWNENVNTAVDTVQARSLMEKGRDLVEQGHGMIMDGLNNVLPEDMQIPEAEIPSMAEINADIQTKLDQAKVIFDANMVKFREAIENFDWDILNIVPDPETEPEAEAEGTPEEHPIAEDEAQGGWWYWF